MAKSFWKNRILLATVSTLGLGMMSAPIATAQVASYYDNNVVVDLSVLEDSGVGIQPRANIQNGATVRVPPTAMPQSRLHGLPASAQNIRLNAPANFGPKVPDQTPQSRIVLKKPDAPTSRPALPASRVAETSPTVMTPAKPAPVVAKSPPPAPEAPARDEVSVSEQDIANAIAKPQPKPAPVEEVKVSKAPPAPVVEEKVEELAPVALVRDEPAQSPEPQEAPASVMAEAPPPPPSTMMETEEVATSITEETAAAPSETAALTSAGSDALRIVFRTGDSAMPGTAQSDLDALATQLKARPDDRIQLQAYAGGEELSASKARRLSLSRALSVRSYLIEAGIRSTRIDVRALGNKTTEEPFDRVDVNITAR